MKQPVILVNKHGRPSMRSTYKAIRADNQFKDIKLLIKSSRFNGMVERQHGKRVKLRGVEQPDCRGKIVARWGSRQPIITDETSIVYNSCENVEKTNSKGQCRKILQDAGVKVPKTFLRNEDMSNIKFPCIGRPEFHGQGRQFYMCNNHAEIEQAKRRGCTYFSEFFAKTREVRCHVFAGKILAVMEKPRPQNPNQVAWNHAVTNLPFSVIDRVNWPQQACLLALEACQVMKLTYSGIDVMIREDENGSESVICELNSSPTLVNSPYVLDKYIQAFKWLFASDKRRPTWDFRKFRKVESLSWKSSQLLPSFEIPAELRLE